MLKYYINMLKYYKIPHQYTASFINILYHIIYIRIIIINMLKYYINMLKIKIAGYVRTWLYTVLVEPLKDGHHWGGEICPL